MLSNINKFQGINQKTHPQPEKLFPLTRESLPQDELLSAQRWGNSPQLWAKVPRCGKFNPRPDLLFPQVRGELARAE